MKISRDNIQQIAQSFTRQVTGIKNKAVEYGGRTFTWCEATKSQLLTKADRLGREVAKTVQTKASMVRKFGVRQLQKARDAISKQYAKAKVRFTSLGNASTPQAPSKQSIVSQDTTQTSTVAPEGTSKKKLPTPPRKDLPAIPKQETRRKIDELNGKIASIGKSEESIGKFRSDIEQLARESTELSLHAAGSPGLTTKLEHQQKALLELAEGDPQLKEGLEKEFKAANSLVRVLVETNTKVEDGVTLSSFLEKLNLPAEDVKTEAQIFGQTETVAKLKMAKRALLMQKGGIDVSHYPPSLAKLADKMELEPSVVKAAFAVFKAQIRDTGKEPPRSLDGHNFYVEGKDIIIEEKIGLAAGSFKLTRRAQVLFQEGKSVTQRPHTPQELKAFNLHKGITDTPSDESKEGVQEKFKDHWTTDANMGATQIQKGNTGDFKVYWKDKQSQPAVVYLDAEGKAVHKSLEVEDVMKEDFTMEGYVKVEIEAAESRKRLLEEKAEKVAELEPEHIQAKYDQLTKDNPGIKLDGGDYDAHLKHLEGKEPFTYLIKYEQTGDWETDFTVELYYVTKSGKPQMVPITGEDFLKEGFSVENMMNKLEGLEVRKFETSGGIQKDAPESSYTLLEMKEQLKNMSDPLDEHFQTDKDNRIWERDLKALEDLKSQATPEIQAKLDNLIGLKKKIAMREEFFEKYQADQKERRKLLETDPKAESEREYKREVKTSFELSRLGTGIEQINKVINVESGGKVVETMLKPIAGQKLPGSHFVDGQSRTFFDMEHFMAEYSKGNLTPEGQIALFDAFEKALEGSVKMEENGYIHRDLKPENILLTASGGALTDFGSTVKAKDDIAIAEYGGTPMYSSPEAVVGRESFNNQAAALDLSSKMDVWSWGMMFHQLTGQETHDHPIFTGLPKESTAEETLDHLYKKGYRSTTFQEQYEKQYHKEPEDKGSLEHLAWECTQIDPDKRPSMREVLSKFQAAKKARIASLPQQAVQVE